VVGVEQWAEIRRLYFVEKRSKWMPSPFRGCSSLPAAAAESLYPDSEKYLDIRDA
jgi:hypothetical protein